MAYFILEPFADFHILSGIEALGPIYASNFTYINIPKFTYKCNLLEYKIFQVQFLKPFVYVGIDYELQKKLKKQFGIVWKKIKFSTDANNDAQEANIAFL